MGTLQKAALLSKRNDVSALELYASQCATKMERLGVEVRQFKTEGGALKGDDLSAIKKFAPQCSFSFSALKLENEASLPGLLGAPHTVWFKDPGFFSAPFIDVEHLHFALTSRSDYLWFKQCGKERVLFLPYPSWTSEKIDSNTPRSFPVLAFPSERTSEEVRAEWQQKCTRLEVLILEGALNRFLENSSNLLLDMVSEAVGMSGMPVSAAQVVKIFDYLESYLSLLEKESLIKSVQKVTEVVEAPKLPFLEALEWMKRSKMVIAGTFGASISVEWIGAVLSGAYPLYCTNPFLEELFPGNGVERTALEPLSKIVKEFLIHEQKRMEKSALLHDQLERALSFDSFVKAIFSHMSAQVHK